MKKKEFVEQVAKETKVTQNDTLMMLDTIMDAIADCIVAGDSIRFPQLGTFSVQKLPARRSNLPGNEMIPERKKARLRMSAELKRRIQS